MHKLKIILHSNYIYLLFVPIILITIIRLSIPKISNYKTTDTIFTGIITNYTIDGSKITMTIKNEEKILGTYYFKTKKEKTYFQDKFKLGDKIKVIGVFSLPKENSTKKLFNYRKYLQRKNIFYNIEITTYKKIKSSKSIFYKLKNNLYTYLSSDPYLLTFILGDKTKLSKEIITSYQKNGISHLFAISGMHIALFSSIIINILNKIKVSNKLSYYLTSVVLIIYLFLTNITPSIIRGVLFFIFFSINKIYNLELKPLLLYAFVLAITLLINPNYIFDISFLYSFLISLTLILTTTYLKSSSYFLTLLKTSIFSYLISIPITIYNFYELNFLSIIYNLFFIPLISIIIFPATILTCICPLILPLYKMLTNFLENLSLLLNNITFTVVIFPKLPFLIYIIEFILITITIKNIVKRKINFSQFITFLFLLLHYLYPYYNSTIYVNFVDVNQGDSVLLNSNNESILIDTGGKKTYYQEDWQIPTRTSSIVTNTTIPLLKSLGIKKLEYLILTHGDYDHMGEAIDLVENFKVEKVIFNCGEFNELEQYLIKVLDKKKIPYYSCIKELNIDNNKLYFLNNKDYGNENDNSSVIYTELENHKFLFMGDAGVDVEEDLIQKYNLQDIDVLKVGHHGSKTSSSKEFINEINPKYSIISVGKNNRYGHPNNSVLDNLEDSKIYRTDLDGSVIFKIKNNKLQIETCTP